MNIRSNNLFYNKIEFIYLYSNNLIIINIISNNSLKKWKLKPQNIEIVAFYLYKYLKFYL